MMSKCHPLAKRSENRDFSDSPSAAHRNKKKKPSQTQQTQISQPTQPERASSRLLVVDI